MQSGLGASHLRFTAPILQTIISAASPPPLAVGDRTKDRTNCKPDIADSATAVAWPTSAERSRMMSLTLRSGKQTLSQPFHATDPARSPTVDAVRRSDHGGRRGQWHTPGRSTMSCAAFQQIGDEAVRNGGGMVMRRRLIEPLVSFANPLALLRFSATIHKS